MGKNGNTTMISARIPSDLVVRVDYIVRNTTIDTINNRSDAVEHALAAFAEAQEREFLRLGIIEAPKKDRA